MRFNYKKALDEVVRAYQSYILSGFSKTSRSKNIEKTSCYIQAIIEINNQFNTCYTTSLERYRDESKKEDIMDRLPLRD